MMQDERSTECNNKEPSMNADTPDTMAPEDIPGDRRSEATGAPGIFGNKDVDMNELPVVTPDNVTTACCSRKRRTTQAYESENAKKYKVNNFNKLFTNKDGYLRQALLEQMNMTSVMSEETMSLDDEKPLSSLGESSSTEINANTTLPDPKNNPSQLDSVRANLGKATKGLDIFRQPSLSSDYSLGNKDSGLYNENLPVVPDLPLLRVKRPAEINMLYHLKECCNCDITFPPEHKVHYSQRLDWNFQQNRSVLKPCRSASRQWHRDLAHWLQFTQVEALEQREGSCLETDDVECATEPEPCEEQEPSVPARGGVPCQQHCALCWDKFDEFFDVDEDEWHLRNAVSHLGQIYHPLCLYDLLSQPEEAEESVAADDNCESFVIEVLDSDE